MKTVTGMEALWGGRPVVKGRHGQRQRVRSVQQRGPCRQLSAAAVHEEEPFGVACVRGPGYCVINFTKEFSVRVPVVKEHVVLNGV